MLSRKRGSRSMRVYFVQYFTTDPAFDLLYFHRDYLRALVSKKVPQNGKETRRGKEDLVGCRGWK